MSAILTSTATLDTIVAVFVDDVAAGFKPEVRTEYLAMRAEYSKIINVDWSAVAPKR